MIQTAAVTVRSQQNSKIVIINVFDWLAIKLKNYLFRNATPTSVVQIGVVLKQERNEYDKGINKLSKAKSSLLAKYLTTIFAKA